MILDSKVLFEKLFEFSPDAVLVTDQEGTIRRANQRTETMFGHARVDLIGKPVELLLPERFLSGHPHHRHAYAAQPHPRPMGVGLDLYGLRKDGTEFPVDIMLSPLQVEEQSFVLAVVRDITRRKIAEQERDLQAKLAREQSALLDVARDSIIVRDLDNRISFWSRGAEEKYGWKRVEVLGKLAHTLLETQFPQSAESVDEALRRNHYWEGEVIHKTKNGDRIVVASRRVLQMDAGGQPVAIFEINNDVTERKNAEEALRRSEQRLRSLFEFSPDAIVVTGRDGKIVDANAQLEKFFGYRRSELMGTAHRGFDSRAFPRGASKASRRLRCTAARSFHGCRPRAVRQAQGRHGIPGGYHARPHGRSRGRLGARRHPRSLAEEERRRGSSPQPATEPVFGRGTPDRTSIR